MPWNANGRLIMSDVALGVLDKLIPWLSELPPRWKPVAAMGLFAGALYAGSCFLIERRLESTAQTTVLTDWLAFALDVKLFTGFIVVMLLALVFLFMVVLAAFPRKS